jgi:hypothetical protein
MRNAVEIGNAEAAAAWLQAGLEDVCYGVGSGVGEFAPIRTASGNLLFNTCAGDSLAASFMFFYRDLPEQLQPLFREGIAQALRKIRNDPNGKVAYELIYFAMMTRAKETLGALGGLLDADLFSARDPTHDIFSIAYDAVGALAASAEDAPVLLAYLRAPYDVGDTRFHLRFIRIVELDPNHLAEYMDEFGERLEKRLQKASRARASTKPIENFAETLMKLVGEEKLRRLATQRSTWSWFLPAP